ncbi:MAG: hypothetical protein ACRBI6_05350, partial [Acidimicrobiales bacterium]
MDYPPYAPAFKYQTSRGARLLTERYIATIEWIASEVLLNRHDWRVDEHGTVLQADSANNSSDRNATIVVLSIHGAAAVANFRRWIGTRLESHIHSAELCVARHPGKTHIHAYVRCENCETAFLT